MTQVRAPMLVWEPVVSETLYFLREGGLSVDPVFELMEREAIRLAFDVSHIGPRIQMLMSRYRQMDLADACVVVMSECMPRPKC